MTTLHETRQEDKKILEILRRLIHIAGISTIVLAELFGKIDLSLIIVSTTILYLVSEYLRLHERQLPIIATITRLAARKEETSGWILSPVSYAIGITVALNLFPRPVNYAAISVLTVGDGLAALVDMRCGSHLIPYNRRKSMEGSITCFLASLISTLTFVDPLTAFLGAVAGTLAESLPTRQAENIIVPMTSGLCMTLALLFT